MKHNETPPLFPGKGFNYRAMAREVKPEIIEKLDGHPRAEAIEAVGEGHEDFIVEARKMILAFKPERRFTGEDAVDAAGVLGLVADEGRLWGNVFNGLSREGLIVKTGEYGVRRNGNPTPIWRVK